MYEESVPTTISSQGPSGKSPRSFGEIPGLWLKFFRMSESFFVQEAPHASHANTLISLAVLVGISTVFSIIFSFISSGIQAIIMPDYAEFAAVGFGASLIGSLCGGLCFGFLGMLLGFYISNGIQYLLAHLFGGDGGFETQTYLVSLYTVPMTVLSQVFGLVFGLLMLPLADLPVLVIIVGGIMALIGLAFSIYLLILNVRALKVTHHLTGFKAVVVILLPIIIFVVLVPCVIIGLLALLGPSIQEVFEEITRELQYY